MKRYTVAYLDVPLDELASIWENATDRSLVAAAAYTADNILTSSPMRHSIHLGEGLWRLEVIPLRFYFTIREENRLIEVTNVVVLTK
jgi:hypothetical protein